MTQRQTEIVLEAVDDSNRNSTSRNSSNYLNFSSAFNKKETDSIRKSSSESSNQSKDATSKKRTILRVNTKDNQAKTMKTSMTVELTDKKERENDSAQDFSQYCAEQVKTPMSKTLEASDNSCVANASSYANQDSGCKSNEFNRFKVNREMSLNSIK